MISAGHVTLRPWERADVAFVFDACQDLEIQRWTRVPRPYTAHDAAKFIASHARAQPEEGSASFAMTRTDNDEVLGSISFNHIEWGSRSGEIGYWVGPDARRQGVAAAGLAALVRWGFSELGLVEARLLAARGNIASHGVATSAGFTFSHVEAGECRDGDDPDDGFVFVLKLAP